jgi:hypothetical protein
MPSESMSHLETLVLYLFASEYDDWRHASYDTQSWSFAYGALASLALVHSLLSPTGSHTLSEVVSRFVVRADTSAGVRARV